MLQGQSFVLLCDGIGLLFLSFPPAELRRGGMDVVVRLKDRGEKDASQTSTGGLQTTLLFELLVQSSIYLTVTRANGDIEEKSKDTLQDFSVLIR